MVRLGTVSKFGSLSHLPHSERHEPQRYNWQHVSFMRHLVRFRKLNPLIKRRVTYRLYALGTFSCLTT